jgi:hypothetical protein
MSRRCGRASGGPDRATVDHVRGTHDGRRAIAEKEDDELGNLLGLGGPTEWNAATGNP